NRVADAPERCGFFRGEERVLPFLPDFERRAVFPDDEPPGVWSVHELGEEGGIVPLRREAIQRVERVARQGGRFREHGPTLCRERSRTPPGIAAGPEILWAALAKAPACCQ